MLVCGLFESRAVCGGLVPGWYHPLPTGEAVAAVRVVTPSRLSLSSLIVAVFVVVVFIVVVARPAATAPGRSRPSAAAVVARPAAAAPGRSTCPNRTTL